MKLLTLDFETYYDKDFSLSKMTMEEYVYDPRFEIIGVALQWGDECPVWYPSQSTALEVLAKIEWADTALLCQNTAFDALVLRRFLGAVPAFYFDTMLMSRPTVMPFTSSSSLAKVAQHLQLGQKGTEVVRALGKRITQFTAQELWQYGEYCRNDVVLTHRVFKRLRPSFCYDELQAIDTTLRMYLHPVLELDANLLEDHLLEVQRVKDNLLNLLPRDITKEDLMSNPKLAAVLTELGVDPPRKISPTTGEETHAFAKTDTEFTELLRHESPLVQAVVAARLGHRSTIEETRTEKLIAVARNYGHLRVPLLYYGAHTGRYSGTEGLNLQNLPRNSQLRRAIMAPDGHQLIVADFKQIEARVNAWIAQEEELLESFKSDPYRQFAARTYNKTPSEVTDRERFIGKTCILGLGYGMGPAKFVDTLAASGTKITAAEAERVVATYRNTYSGIKQQWKICEQLLSAMGQGYSYDDNSKLLRVVRVLPQALLLPNGLSLVYHHLQKTNDGWQYLSGKLWKKIYGAKLYENIVQAVARIVMTEAMNRIPYKLALTVHDELVFCVPETEVHEASELIQKEMTTPPAWAIGLPLEVELSHSKRYGDAK